MNLFSNSTINLTREPQVLGMPQLEVPLTKAKLQVNDKGYSILCKPPSIEVNHRILQPKLTTHYRHTKYTSQISSRIADWLFWRSTLNHPQEVIKSAHQQTQKSVVPNTNTCKTVSHKCNPTTSTNQTNLTPSLHLQFTILHKFPTRVRYIIPQGLLRTTSAQACKSVEPRYKTSALTCA